MPDTNPPHRAIMSYTRFDDQSNRGHLTAFCERLSTEVQLHSGEPFPIFQDVKDIKWGEPFEQRIEDALNRVQFFIPILTPSFFKSAYCRAELQHFLRHAAALERNDLILPVYYIRCPELERPDRRATDALAQTLAHHQYEDWRDLRYESFDHPQVRRMLARMAEQICDALDRLPTPAPSAPTPDPDIIPRREADAAPSSPPPAAPSPTPVPPSPPPDPQIMRLHERAFNPRVESDPNQRNAAAEELDRLGADTRTALELEHPDYWARRIEPGPFRMGDDNGVYDDEKPAFVAHIRRPYALARFPVTNRQYLRFLQDLKRQGRGEEAQQRRPRQGWDAAGYPVGKGNHPVVGVSWEDSCAFAHWVNDLLHSQGILKAHEEVRLPTEPEWERAAAYPVALPADQPGAGKRVYPWGDTWDKAGQHSALSPSLTAVTDGSIITGVQANTDTSGVGGTSVVGVFPYGAADCGAEELAGNVWEWCSTQYLPYPLPEKLAAETIFNTKEYLYRTYVLRGGSWSCDSSDARCARRHGLRPDYVDGNVGVRLARLFS